MRRRIHSLGRSEYLLWTCRSTLVCPASHGAWCASLSCWQRRRSLAADEAYAPLGLRSQKCNGPLSDSGDRVDAFPGCARGSCCVLDAFGTRGHFYTGEIISALEASPSPIHSTKAYRTQILEVC